MFGNMTYDETWVVSSIKKLDECLQGQISYQRSLWMSAWIKKSTLWKKFLKNTIVRKLICEDRILLVVWEKFGTIICFCQCEENCYQYRCGWVVRDFEREAKTRCNFQFRLARRHLFNEIFKNDNVQGL